MAGAGTQALLETVTLDVLTKVVQLHDGVLGHASSRALDTSGWIIDTGKIQADGSVVVAPVLAQECNRRLELLAKVLRGPPQEAFEGGSNSLQQFLHEG